MPKKKIFLIILLGIACIFAAISVNKKLSEASDMNRYSKGMAFYKSHDYQNSYYQFSQVSNFSVLKPAAVFRQARSATLVGDTKSAIRNYNVILARYPLSPFDPVSEYNLAVLLYQNKDLNASERHFKHIIRRDKNTEFAKAAEYYLGLMDKNGVTHLINYIVLSPNGRFTQKSIDKIVASGVKLSNSDNLKIANSYLKQEKYNESIKFYKKTTIKYSWANFAKADNKGSLELPSYGLADFGFSYKMLVGANKNKSVNFRLNINNVFDEIYIAESRTNTFADDNIDSKNPSKGTYASNNMLYDGIATTNQVFFGFGRTWNFSLRYDF